MLGVNEKEFALLNPPLDRIPIFFFPQQEGEAPLRRLASWEMTYMQKNCFPDIPQQLICLLKHEI